MANSLPTFFHSSIASFSQSCRKVVCASTCKQNSSFPTIFLVKARASAGPFAATLKTAKRRIWSKRGHFVLPSSTMILVMSVRIFCLRIVLTPVIISKCEYMCETQSRSIHHFVRSTYRRSRSTQRGRSHLRDHFAQWHQQQSCLDWQQYRRYFWLFRHTSFRLVWKERRRWVSNGWQKEATSMLIDDGIVIMYLETTEEKQRQSHLHPELGLRENGKMWLAHLGPQSSSCRQRLWLPSWSVRVPSYTL